MHPDRLSRHPIAPLAPQRTAPPAPIEAAASPATKPESIDWGPAFPAANFTQIPNGVFNLVRNGRLIPFDLLTFGYFLAKAGAMEATGKRDYTIVPEAQTAADLKCCVRTIRASVVRLLAEDLIERRDTPGNTHTRILVKVDGADVVQRHRKFPPTKIRTRAKLTVPPSCPTPQQLEPTIPPLEDNEMPF